MVKKALFKKIDDLQDLDALREFQKNEIRPLEPGEERRKLIQEINAKAAEISKAAAVKSGK